MQEKIDIKQALRVFQIIREEGTRKEDEYCLSGLCAMTDFDGYTVSIYNDYAHLDIFFHNSFNFSAINDKEKAAFLEKLALLDKRH